MIRTFALRALLATVALFAAASPSQASLVFNFEFDNTPDGTVAPPIVGTGTLTLNADPGLGVSAFSPFLTSMSFSFVTGSSFTEADLQTPLVNILINIVDLGGGNRGISFGGDRGGPFSGSMDFIKDGTTLSFQPDFGPLYFSDNFFGTFQGIASATVVPEPATLALSSTFGLAGLIVLARRRKANAA